MIGNLLARITETSGHRTVAVGNGKKKPVYSLKT